MADSPKQDSPSQEQLKTLAEKLATLDSKTDSNAKAIEQILSILTSIERDGVRVKL